MRVRRRRPGGEDVPEWRCPAEVLLRSGGRGGRLATEYRPRREGRCRHWFHKVLDKKPWAVRLHPTGKTYGFLGWNGESQTTLFLCAKTPKAKTCRCRVPDRAPNIIVKHQKHFRAYAATRVHHVGVGKSHPTSGDCWRPPYPRRTAPRFAAGTTARRFLPETRSSLILSSSNSTSRRITATSCFRR